MTTQSWYFVNFCIALIAINCCTVVTIPISRPGAVIGTIQAYDTITTKIIFSVNVNIPRFGTSFFGKLEGKDVVSCPQVGHWIVYHVCESHSNLAK